ncbi:hypothetical protein EYC80_003220 [Monilinia laxa]|uniref:CFEM domain-containing protein n=1 Tax=Monilinia laxa TaxID=61186 RepID=A0A5N6KD15_MONLA|nr:hypothetical protein EYC80_003220 [Monilinia laxa]
MIFFYCSVILWFSTFVNTQSLSDEISSFPSCSDSCIETATNSLGCSVGDYSCICANESGTSTQSPIILSAISCIQDACSLIDANTTVKVVGQICVLINDPTSSTASSSSSSKTSSSSSSSSSFTTSSKISITSSSATTTTTSVSMTSTSVTTMPTSTSAEPSIASMSSSSSSEKGVSNVAIAIIIVAAVTFLLMLAVGARLLWKRRANQEDSSRRDKFTNMEEGGGKARKPVDLQGTDSQIFKWGGIGVRKSIRVQTERITSYITPISPKTRSRSDSWGEPRGLLASVDENLRGVGHSPGPVGSIDTSPVRWPSTSTTSSPTSPEMTEPRGVLFPAHHYYSNSQSRESLPPILPALDLPSITLSTTSRPNTPRQASPKTPPPPRVPVKSIGRLDRPYSEFSHQTPTSPLTIGISYEAPRSLSVSESIFYPLCFSNRSRHSIVSMPKTPPTSNQYTSNQYSSPPSSPVQSPSAQSFHTFGARYSTHSQASISTFQTFTTSPQDITDAPPLPTIPSIYPISTCTPISYSLPPTTSLTVDETSLITDEASLTNEEISTADESTQYHHIKQTSISKIKPKMVYISNTPGISVHSDSINPPSPKKHDTPPPAPTSTLTSTSTPKNPFTTPTNPFTNPAPPPPPPPSTPTLKPQPAIAIKSVIDRFNNLSSTNTEPSSILPPAKLKPATQEPFQAVAEKKKFQEPQEDMRMHGQGSVDLGERVTNWVLEFGVGAGGYFDEEAGWSVCLSSANCIYYGKSGSQRECWNWSWAFARMQRWVLISLMDIHWRISFLQIYVDTRE